MVEKKPKVIISKCLEHGYCRYDGSQISSPFVRRIRDYVDLIPVCPEVEIGLSIPREAIRVIKKDDGYQLIYSLTGHEVTEDMVTFTQGFINQVHEDRIHGFILKGRSPSCGIKDVKVYKTFGKSSALPEKVSGFFGGEIVQAFEGLAIEDEGRLLNYNIRDHFLTKLYTLMRFDDIVDNKSIGDLVTFHSHNKYLLMAYHQKNQNILGRIVANHDKKPVGDVIEDYYKFLKLTLEKPLRRGSNINMLMHLLGYFKNNLSKEEKAYFLDMLEQYSQKKIPFSVPISIIYSWVVRFNEPYLSQQTIFVPYPREILDVTDSGKGID
jgi:uncharacterized protein YbgA (DUF1722 family)/uncharacterized protein YbbK (DUF523 family)